MRGQEGVSESREGGKVWVAHEIIDDGEVNLLGGHGCELGMREEEGRVY